MNSSLKKLYFAIKILFVGMVLGIAFHAFQGLVLHHSYPLNTFLFRGCTFSDFYEVLQSAANWDPYSTWSVYFPFTYVIFHPLAAVQKNIVLVVFTIISLLGIWVALNEILKQAVPTNRQAAQGAGLLIGLAYPIWFCLQRGNIEIGLLFLICGFLLMVKRENFWAGLLFIVPAICMKFYPAVFLALFIRRGQLKYLGFAIFLFLFTTFISLTLFNHTWIEDLHLWKIQLDKFKSVYIIGNGSMGGSASIWNAAKLVLFGWLFAESGNRELFPEVSALTQYTAPLLSIYSASMIFFAGAVTWYVAIVERQFWRKVIVLGLFMVLAPQGGADYKLIHILAVLAVAIAITTRRKHDWLVVGLLAIVLLPKKYWFFPQIVTDSGCSDCSIAVLINPMLMLTALTFVCIDGWAASTINGRRIRWTLALPSSICRNKSYHSNGSSR